MIEVKYNRYLEDLVTLMRWMRLQCRLRLVANKERYSWRLSMHHSVLRHGKNRLSHMTMPWKAKCSTTKYSVRLPNLV